MLHGGLHCGSCFQLFKDTFAMVTRRQASLFLAGVPAVESMRNRWNPEQARLIPAHLTLCREDEISDWDGLQVKMKSLCPFEIHFAFGAPVRDGNFVYLPILDGLDSFRKLRRQLLSENARNLEPHVTIIHPRNGICTDCIFSEIQQSIQPFGTSIRDVRLIEQVDGGVWRTFALIA
jgi:hypothetical protein